MHRSAEPDRVLTPESVVQHHTMSSLPSPFTAAHRSYVKTLYRRILTNELNWIVRRDLWRAKALAIRAEFERNR